MNAGIRLADGERRTMAKMTGTGSRARAVPAATDPRPEERP
jgi:hypothetical protein